MGKLWADKQFPGEGYEVVVQMKTPTVSTAYELLLVDYVDLLKGVGEWEGKHKSIGCGYNPPFATVWFGTELDAFPDYIVNGAPPIEEPMENESASNSSLGPIIGGVIG